MVYNDKEKGETYDEDQGDDDGGGFPGYMSDGTKLTLDGVRLYPNYEGNAASEWGLNTSLVNFRNPATIEITNGGLYLGKLGTLNTLSLVLHSSTLWIREYDSVAGLDVVLDDSTLEVPDHVLNFSEFVFRGAAPAAKVCNLADIPLTLTYELPEMPYVEAPLRQSTMVGGSVQTLSAGQVTVAISPNSPARTSRAKGNYPLIGWDATKKVDNVDTVFGIDTNCLVSVEGKKGRDNESWGWKEGVDPSEKDPQYLFYDLTRLDGFAVFIN